MRVQVFGRPANDVDSRYDVILDNEKPSLGYGNNGRLTVGEVFRLDRDWQYRLAGHALPCGDCFRTQRDAVRGLLTAIARTPIR